MKVLSAKNKAKKNNIWRFSLISRGDSNPKMGTKMAKEASFPDSCTEKLYLSHLLDERDMCDY